MFQPFNVLLYYCHIPGVIISLCWDMEGWAVGIYTAKKKGQLDAPIKWIRNSRLLSILRQGDSPTWADLFNSVALSSHPNDSREGKLHLI